MKLIVGKNQINNAPEDFLRQVGYAYIFDKHAGKGSFVRRLTRDHYPRLHMYLKSEKEKVVFNLHLDQKKASYQGSNMHNAEYDGEVVETEIERLKNIILGGINAQKSQDVSNNELENMAEKKLGAGIIEERKNDKKSFWKKIFKK